MDYYADPFSLPQELYFGIIFWNYVPYWIYILELRTILNLKVPLRSYTIWIPRPEIGHIYLIRRLYNSYLKLGHIVPELIQVYKR